MAESPLNGSEILIVEDETLLRKRLSAYLEKRGASVVQVATLEQAGQALRNMDFAFLLLDINLPDGEGLDLLRKKQVPETTVTIILTAEGGVERAVEAMRLGAADYLGKPLEPAELPLVMARALKARNDQRLTEHRERAGRESGDVFIGPGLEAVREQLDRILLADRRLQTRLPPVLIEGETGTGKTTFARWLHANGPRADKPLVEVNCSALPDQLAESELFGHERGAFTDARNSRIGLFEAADGGTLFLDELPSLSLPTQAKVLKVVEDGLIRRIGGNREIHVDVRLVTATNRDMRALIAEGQFREDLYHRLDLLRVSLPPLRERGDLPVLARHLLGQLAQKYRLGSLRLSSMGEAQLRAHKWPGNVRELAHELERAVVYNLGANEISLTALPVPTAQVAAEPGGGWFNTAFQFPEEGFDLEAAINQIIQHALAQADGNVSAAARLLGVNRDYIRYRLRKPAD